MKHLLFTLTLLSSFLTFGQSEQYKDMLKTYYDGFPTISISQARKKIGQKNVTFIDTRETKEFQVGHIKTAKCVGYDNFSLKKMEGIPKTNEIIVYCSIGARSQDIGKRLKKAGYTNVKNLYGGLFHWSNSEYPMVNSTGKPTKNIHGYSIDWAKWIQKGNIIY